ncbi:unnamed protein product [Penicillium pancosmium]
MSKRTLDAFFKPPPKRTKPDNTTSSTTTTNENAPSRPQSPDSHPTYPHPIAKLPTHLEKSLLESTAPETNREGKIMNNQPDLDCVYYQPFIPRRIANELFRVLRAELPFYRVVYFAKRGGVDVQIKTPRFTTVFGVDEGCFFSDADAVDDGNGSVNGNAHADAAAAAADTPSNSKSQYKTSPLTLRKRPTTTNTSNTIPKYTYPPRPIPSILQSLKKAVESTTKETYNFVLVNYYATGEDSIAFHSDDERFLGFEPAIASLSLGGEREFLLKHKPVPAEVAATGSAGGGGGGAAGGTTIKLPLGSGDMILMLFRNGKGGE